MREQGFSPCLKSPDFKVPASCHLFRNRKLKCVKGTVLLGMDVEGTPLPQWCSGISQ